jgi:hypothetical protein
MHVLWGCPGSALGPPLGSGCASSPTQHDNIGGGRGTARRVYSGRAVDDWQCQVDRGTRTEPGKPALLCIMHPSPGGLPRPTPASDIPDPKLFSQWRNVPTRGQLLLPVLGYCGHTCLAFSRATFRSGPSVTPKQPSRCFFYCLFPCMLTDAVCAMDMISARILVSSPRLCFRLASIGLRRTQKCGNVSRRPGFALYSEMPSRHVGTEAAGPRVPFYDCSTEVESSAMHLTSS